MRMGRKGAFFLLVVAALWAVIPALACLAPAAHHSCCQGKVMGDCCAPAMWQCGDCCRVQPADAPLLPGSASAAEHLIGSAPSPALFAQALPPETGTAMVPVSEAPLPPGSPGADSILRI